MKKAIEESPAGETQFGHKLRNKFTCPANKACFSSPWCSVDKIDLFARLDSTGKHIAQVLTISAKWMPIMQKPHDLNLIYNKDFCTVVPWLSNSPASQNEVINWHIWLDCLF